MKFRLRDYILYPAAIWKQHKFLEQSQYWSEQKRKAWTQEKLEKTLNFAVKHVPYYKKTLGPFQSQFNNMIDKLDLSELPTITKDIIRNHYHELIADNAKQTRTHIERTSGSTGAPMQVLLDGHSDINQFTAIWRMLNWAGYKFGNRFASIIPNMEKEIKREYFYNIKQNALEFAFVNLKSEKIQQYVDVLRKFNPVLIKSYTSTLALFAHWIRDAGITDFHPKAVVTSAETLLDHQKTIITEALHCKIYDFYSQNERACLFSTCEHGIYHIHEEYSFVELVSETQDASMQPGDSAEIVATTFENFVMPLIRYQTNDMTTISANTACQCGKTYKTVERIIGRADDMIYTPEGLEVARLDNTFKDSPGIQEAQFVQNEVSKIQINIVRSPNFQQSDLDNLYRRLQYRLGDSIEIKINFVSELPLGKNGKKKFIVSNVDKATIKTKMVENV